MTGQYLLLLNREKKKFWTLLSLMIYFIKFLIIKQVTDMFITGMHGKHSLVVIMKYSIF